MLNGKTFAIAAAAGLACVLVVYASVRSGFAGAPILPFAAFPIYVATLAWGTHAGMVASISAILFSAALVSPQMAVAVGLAFSVPASIVGHQANLAQQDERGQMEWYPLPRLFFTLALVVALGLAAMSAFVGYEGIREQALPQISRMIEQVVSENPYFQQLTAPEIEVLEAWTFNAIPFWISGFWLIVHVINLQLAAMVCRMSGLLPRPRDDIPATASLPFAAIGVLFASFAVVMLFSAKAQFYAGHFLGTFLMAFSLAGLAASHFNARKSAANVLLLIIGYLAIILFFFPVFFFAIGGIARSFKSRNLPPSAGGTNHP